MGVSTDMMVQHDGQRKNKSTTILQNETKAGSLLSDQAGDGYPTFVSCLWGKLTFFVTSQERTQVTAANSAK